MRIAVLSDTIYPTPTEGGHGLGRAVYNIARHLVLLGHEVTLFALRGSALPGGSVLTTDIDTVGGEDILAEEIRKRERDFDVALDSGHLHSYARRASLPTVALFQDMLTWAAPNAVFVSAAQRDYLKLSGPVVYNGIEFGDYPLYEGPRESWLLFMGGSIWHKGWAMAQEVAALCGRELRSYGAGTPNGPIRGADKAWALQHAHCLLFPSVLDAGPLTTLEAQACGTPVVALAMYGTCEYVQHGVGGYLCQDREEMARAVEKAGALRPGAVHAAVASRTAAEQARQIEALLHDCRQGKRW